MIEEIAMELSKWQLQRCFSMKYPMFKVHTPVNDALKGIENVLQSGFINEVIAGKGLKTLFQLFGCKKSASVNSCTCSYPGLCSS